MWIKQLRLVLIMVLTGTITWIAAGVNSRAASEAAGEFAYTNADLCLHSRNSGRD